MFTAAACASFLSVAFAADPVAEFQARYPAYRITITTASGSSVYYRVAADAPPQLRRAYKVLEVAEREVLVSDALQHLELEYVQNERRLETLRTAFIESYLSHMMYPSNARGPSFNSRLLLSPPTSAFKWAMAADIGNSPMADRAIRAIDRLTSAEFQLQQTLLDLAFPGRPKAAAPVALAEPSAAGSDHPAESVQEIEQAAARAMSLAAERERAAQARDLAAQKRYYSAPRAGREAAHQTWTEARNEWARAHRESSEARKQWMAAHNPVAKSPITSNSTIRPAAPPTPIAGRAFHASPSVIVRSNHP
jgi:hypothetical protein